ncbi:MAG: sulfatase maturation enzyme AslB (radical SAM superfamily) [Myxococcota bacterium]|jgi:sulfatase maturation enzyme AslB (radical SAM superfamily)
MSASLKTRLIKGAIPGLLRRGRAPLAVSWIVTNRCNLRCVYCGCPDNVGNELSTDEAMDVIDALDELGCVAAHLTGGEPLVRKDLGRLIQRLRFHAIRVTLSSNGTLVPRKMRILRDCAEVSLSLDGPPEVHDLNRAEGQVDQVLAALESLQAGGVPRKLQCLVTRRTDARCLDFVLEQGRRFEAPVFFQPALDIVLATEDPNPVVAEASHVAAIFQDLQTRRAAGQPVGNSVGALQHLGTWPTPRPLTCPINRAVVRIGPEGILLPCHERADLPAGQSVRDGGFAAAFARLKLQKCTECWGSGRAEIRDAMSRGPAAWPEFLKKRGHF